MKYFNRLAIILMVAIFSSGCSKEDFEPYDVPYLHIMKDGMAKETVSSVANFLGDYKIYLSSKPLDEMLLVQFSIAVGDGLVEGVDYELVTAVNSLAFLPGIYDMSIRIKWLPHPVDPSKDNTLTIRLEGNSQDITMGLPGPDEYQRCFVITKQN